MKKPVIISLILLIFTLPILAAACGPVNESTEVVIDMELRREIDQLFGRLEFEQARSLLQDKMDEGLTDVVALANYGFMEYKIYQNYGTAINILEKAIKLDPDNARLYATMRYRR
ncbi:MAG: hypothetical protein AB1767_03395 [Bacillota bacterium]